MKTTYILLICLFYVSAVFSQQSPLLGKYRSMALEYNHDLQAADKNISSSMELVKSAKADLKPKLSGEANFQYTGNPIELTLNLPQAGQPLTFEGRDMKYGASLSLMQPLYTGGRILESIRLAKYQQTTAVYQAELLQSSVCYQTDIQYWNTVARAELVRIAADYRNSMAALVQTIRERVQVGLVDPQDLLMAEVKLNEAEYQVLQAQSSFDNGRMAFNSLIGIDLKTSTQIEDTLPDVILSDELLLSDGANRPELQIAHNRIKIAESTGKLTDARYKPQLYVGLDGSYSSPGYNFKADLDPNYAVYAKVSVPLFEWGKRRNEKRSSAWKVGMANDFLDKTTDDIRLEVQTAHNSLSQAMEQVRLTGNSLEKSRENERKALERYDEGKISVIEVIEAQNYRQTSQINHVQAKASAQGYYSALIKALHKY